MFTILSLQSRRVRLFFALLGSSLSALAHTTPADFTGLAPAPPVPDSVACALVAVPDSAGTVAAPDSVRARRPRRSDYNVVPGETWHYERPRPLRWLLHIPRDLGQFPAYAFQRDKVAPIAKLLVASGLLYVADRPLLDIAQDIGRNVGLNPRSTQKTLVEIPFSLGSINLPFEFNVPDNLNSTFYYIGDGWTHLSVATSFMAYGLAARDNRAAQTATQLGEAILSSGLVVQALKRSTGRQSPYVATSERGEWELFPSFKRYQSHVPNFDAFPTGHLATAMATVTVIAENYPEKRFVRPVGYGLMTLLGYAMLNNGVHWASDYPVGIALGYAFAKIAVRNGHAVVPAAPAGTGYAPPRLPPWYRRGQWSPFSYGPFTGASWTLRW